MAISLDFFGATALGPIETNIGGFGHPFVWPVWAPAAYRAIDNFGGIAADGFTYSDGVSQWILVETADTVYVWDLFDAIWAKLVAQNVQSVLFNLQSIPQWVSVGNAYSFASVTVSSATPCVVTATGNNFANGWKVFFTGGTLPTGLTLGHVYFVVHNGTDGTGKFRLSLTSGGADINTTGTAGTSTVTALDSPPATMSKLTDWVTSVLTRATAKGLPIKFIEGLNEANNGVGFYVGTMAELVTMQQTVYNAAKAFDSTIQVLSPPMQSLGTGGTISPGNAIGGNTYLDSFLTAGGGAYCDILGFHGYPTDPGTYSPATYATTLAAFIAMIASHGQGTKPLWNTEYSTLAGVAATNKTYLGRTTFLDLSYSVARKYYYAVDGNDPLWDPPPTATFGALNAAGIAQLQIIGWLVGLTMTAPVSTVGVIQSCDFSGNGGYIARAVWTTDGTTPSYTKPSWTKQYRALDGTVTTNPGSTITLGADPLFLEGTTVSVGNKNLGWYYS